MSAQALRERAAAKRAAGLLWEAAMADRKADRIERATFACPVTVGVLSDLYDEAIEDVQRESSHLGSSYEAAVERAASIHSALQELGALN